MRAGVFMVKHISESSFISERDGSEFAIPILVISWFPSIKTTGNPLSNTVSLIPPTFYLITFPNLFPHTNSCFTWQQQVIYSSTTFFTSKNSSDHSPLTQYFTISFSLKTRISSSSTFTFEFSATFKAKFLYFETYLTSSFPKMTTPSSASFLKNLASQHQIVEYFSHSS